MEFTREARGTFANSIVHTVKFRYFEEMFSSQGYRGVLLFKLPEVLTHLPSGIKTIACCVIIAPRNSLQIQSAVRFVHCGFSPPSENHDITRSAWPSHRAETSSAVGVSSAVVTSLIYLTIISEESLRHVRVHSAFCPPLV